MKLNSIIKFAIMLIISLSMGKAYGQTFSIVVGEILTLNVPSVSLGYVDKAIWACSNPAISFVSKSTISANVTALESFDGYATVELVYVEKYVDAKGFTRANTYTKNYYISCKTNATGSEPSTVATSISVEPEIKVAIGEKAKIYYKLYPEGSIADLYSKNTPNSHFFCLGLYENNGYFEGIARSVGVDYVTIYFYNEENEKKSGTCKVTVYDPTWIEPRSVSIQNVLLMSVGDVKRLLPLFTPSSATALYEWSSDNSLVAYISSGEVVAKDPGIANITLKTSNGLISNCTVIVVKNGLSMPGVDNALIRAANMLKVTENENVK